MGDVRGRLFVPIPRGRSYAEINEWLMDRCIEDAKKRPHPTIEGKTVWQVFEEERPFLMAYRGPFDGFHATEVAVSKTCLVRFDNNHYSVAARAVGRPVDVRAYADRIVIRQDGETVAEHPRSFGRGEIAYDPWHYVPILTRKPGALRNGAPFGREQIRRSSFQGSPLVAENLQRKSSIQFRIVDASSLEPAVLADRMRSGCVPEPRTPHR